MIIISHLSLVIRSRTTTHKTLHLARAKPLCVFYETATRQKIRRMAKLPEKTLSIIFALQRQLIEGIDEAAATETMLFERFGETEVTLPVLEQLLNVKERLLAPYSRLGALLPRIAEYHPTAPTDVIDLLYQTIEQAQAARDASSASIGEAKRDFDLA